MIRHNVCKAHAFYFIVFTFYSKIYVEKLFHLCKANRILKICFCYTNLPSVKFMRQCIDIDCQYTGLRNTKTRQCQWNPCIVSLLVLWWRHGMETKSGLLAICDSNLLVMDSPHKGLFSRWFDLALLALAKFTNAYWEYHVDTVHTWWDILLKDSLTICEIRWKTSCTCFNENS